MGTMLSGGEGIALDRFEGTSPRSPSIRNDLNADSGFDRGELRTVASREVSLRGPAGKLRLATDRSSIGNPGSGKQTPNGGVAGGFTQGSGREIQTGDGP